MVGNFRRAVKAGFPAVALMPARRCQGGCRCRRNIAFVPLRAHICAQFSSPRFRRIAMADADFDLDRLAAYLHMMPDDVQKLAERGKLPGRRVGGAWRFSAAEIHHWMEDRIGLSD